MVGVGGALSRPQLPTREGKLTNSQNHVLNLTRRGQGENSNIRSRFAFANGFGNVFETAKLIAKIASVYSLAKLLARMANVQLWNVTLPELNVLRKTGKYFIILTLKHQLKQSRKQATIVLESLYSAEAKAKLLPWKDHIFLGSVSLEVVLIQVGGPKGKNCKQGEICLHFGLVICKLKHKCIYFPPFWDDCSRLIIWNLLR